MEAVITKIFDAVFSEYGLIGSTFVGLLIWVMRENNIREQKYQITIVRNQDIISKNQDIILEQAKNFDIVKKIEEDVAHLRNIIVNGKQK